MPRPFIGLRVSLVAVITTYLTVGFATPAHAYIDPGSGSMMLQMLLGGVAGVVVIFKLYWQRLIERVSQFRSRSTQQLPQ